MVSMISKISMVRKMMRLTEKENHLLRRDVVMRVAVENRIINKMELDKEKIS